MRKFTKEITALLATAALGASMGTVSASSKDKVRSSGANASSKTNSLQESATEFVEGVAIADSYTDVTPIVGTTVAEIVTDPQVEWYTEGTTVSEEYTHPTKEPTLMGTTVCEEFTFPTEEPTIMGTSVSEEVTEPFEEETEDPSMIGTTVSEQVTEPEEIIPIDPPDGDVNDDGVLNAADLVLFHRYLIRPHSVKLMNKDAADMVHDGKLNVFDLIKMKRTLIESKYHKSK